MDTEVEEEGPVIYICLGWPRCARNIFLGVCPFCKRCVTDEDFENLEPTEH